MGGPPISKEVKDLVVQTWLELTSKDSKSTAKDVYYLLESRLSTDKSKKYRMPSMRAVQQIIRESKQHLEKLSKSGISINEEWTMASLDKYELPADAIPFVIKVWRYAKNTNEHFTVIQAKWVARLYRLWEDITLLWYHSNWYSELQRTSIVSNETFNTFYPDTQLFMSDWEVMTLISTHSFKQISMRSALPILEHQDGDISEELLHYNSRRDLELFALFNEASDKFHTKLFKLFLELPSLNSLKLDYDTKMVYLRLYTHLIRGPAWNTLPPKEALNVITSLRNWVISENETIKNEPDTVQPFLHGPMPFELIEKVGYELPPMAEEEQK